MTEEQEKLIKKAIVLNAQFYGLQLSAPVLGLYDYGWYSLVAYNIHQSHLPNNYQVPLTPIGVHRYSLWLKTLRVFV